MSSETITRNDLEAILNGIYPLKNNIFWAIYNTTSYQEIAAALADNKLVIVAVSNSYNSFNAYVYAFANASSFYFTRMHGSIDSPSYKVVSVDNTNVWTTNTLTMADQVIEQGTVAGGHGTWFYTKWNSGKIEAWYDMDSAVSVAITTSVASTYRGSFNITIPNGIFSSTPTMGTITVTNSGTTIHGNLRMVSNTQAEALVTRDASSTTSITAGIYIMYFPHS